MPELPEVERGRKMLEEIAVGRKIEGVLCKDDEIVFDGVSPEQMRVALEGRRILAARRRGKQLWLELDERPWPLFHFGMTGSFRVPGGTTLRLASSPRGPEEGWPPRFEKIRLLLDDGGEIAMVNKRRLGRIRLRDDPENEPPISRLGFDPLLDLPSAPKIAARIGRRTVSLKGLLLDQSFAAGVGNWIADEVLYQARLDPRRAAASLDAEEVGRLRAKLKSVIGTAVRVDAEKERFPRGWLFHRRWGKQEGAKTARGEPIEHLTVAGRTTAWVPSIQR